MRTSELHNKTFFPGAKILIVGEKLQSTSDLNEKLISIGFKTQLLTSAEEAIEKLESIFPDLITIFNRLPGMDGITLCRTLKTNDSWNSLPVFVVSNNANDDCIKALDCGADDFINTACNADELRARMDKSLRIHESLESKKILETSLDNLVKDIEYALSMFRRSPWDTKSARMEFAQKILSQKSGNNPPQIIAIREKTETDVSTCRLYQKNEDHSICETLLQSTCDDCCLCSTNIEKWPYWDLRWGNGNEAFLPNDLSERLNIIKNFAASRITGGCIAAFNFSNNASRKDAELLQSMATHFKLATEIPATVNEAETSWTMTLNLLAGICEPEYKKPEAHAHRISMFSAFLANEMGMDPSFVKTIAYSAQLHDIGKTKIPIWLLKKNEPLTVDEFEVIKEHAALGAEMLRGIPQLEMAVEIALAHHERWDGTGYPLGIAKEKIPPSARIVSLADVYDALRTERPFRAAYSHAEASSIITMGDWKTSPDQFDPDVLEAFKRSAMRFEEVFAAGIADPP